MAHSVPPERAITEVDAWHFSQPIAAQPTCPLTTATNHASTAAKSTKSLGRPCIKPFDRWKPLGGGADHDIFRRFKILGTEEETFLAYWARNPSRKGIISRDETGTLVFRISSTNISDLACMHIGQPDTQALATQWLHVYDQDGVPWLNQIAHTDRKYFPVQIYDTTDQPMLASGNLGRFGPSGLTVQEFVNRNLC